MIPKGLTGLTVALIALGVSVQALLLGHLLLTTVLSELTPTWPGPFVRAAHAALWPVARLAGQTPDQATLTVVLGAMSLYLVLLIGGVIVMSMVARAERARHPWHPPSA